MFITDKGMKVEDRDPLIFWENGHGDIIGVSNWLPKHYQTSS